MITTLTNGRFARAAGFVLAALVALAAGCGPSDPTGAGVAIPPKGQSNKSALNVGLVTPPGVNAPAPILGAAKAEAEAFLKLVQSDPVAASARIAPAFKKIVTNALIYEDEKKLGYSESDTQKYLKEACAAVSGWDVRTVVVAPDGGEYSVRGEAKMVSGDGRFAVRLARAGDTWQITRFALSRIANSGGGLQLDTDPEEKWVRETTLDFLEALAGGDPDHLLCMALMTEAFKKRLPSPSIADAGLGYAKKDVRKWLTDLGKGVTRCKLTMQSADAKGHPFTGELVGSSKPIVFTLWVVKDADGAWKIDEFVVR